MPISVELARDLVLEFCATFPAVPRQNDFVIRPTQEDIYGPKATIEQYGRILGGYLPATSDLYRGQFHFAAAAASDEEHFKRTLRHEALGHFGLNTFKPEEKKGILTALVGARESPGISELWAIVDKQYSGKSELEKAEEVFAAASEAPPQLQRVSKNEAETSLRETAIERFRLMSLTDLTNITALVADGLHNRTRSQKTFPATNQAQFKRESTMDDKKKPFHQAVAEKLIEQLKEGVAPWQKPWEPGTPNSVMPFNPTTGKRYKGINALQLMSQGHDDQRWMTYKQASAVDAQVRQGEKGTPIQYWKFSEEQVKLDAQGKPVRDGQGEIVKENVKLERPRVFMATVFNGSQIDGLPPIHARERKEQTWTAVDRAEQILQASGADIRHSEQNRAFYRPATDKIHMPDKAQFPSADNYYATALHELGHWTGHESRLDRDLTNPFGSEGYAKEELRAEITSMILGDELGIGHDPKQHASYVGSWIEVLKQDPLEIFRAAADAEKIQEYILGLEQKQIQALEQAENLAPTLLSDKPTPDAFIDTNGKIRTWDAADPVEPDWRGILKKDDKFWYVGQDDGQRSFTALKATTVPEARAEGEIVKALEVGVAEVFNDPGYSFDHFVGAASLQDNLRTRGLTTIGNVTGSDPAQFNATALARLSPVFGIEESHDKPDNSYLERKSLAQSFAVKAEQLVEQLQTQNLQKHNLKDNMVSPEANELGGRLVDRLESSGVMTRPDAVVTKALRDLRISTDVSRAIDLEIFEEASQKAFNFKLPEKWNGRVQVQGNVYEEIDGKSHATSAESLGVKPDVWGVYAQQEDGMHQWLADFSEQDQAAALAERLKLVAAFSNSNPYEQSAQLARINEERIRSDPNSTAEQRAAAREDRKDAEAQAALNDPELQASIAEMERRYSVESSYGPAAADLGDHPRFSDLPAQMTLAEFSKVADARPLENHGRMWEVFVGSDSYGFADAATAQGAIAEAHEREVNNALYSRTGDNQGVLEVQPMPPKRVLVEYPDLVDKFSSALPQLASTGSVPSNDREGQSAAAPEKTFINVPFKEKEAAKALGAKWDRQEQSWYVPAGVAVAPFAQWANESATVVGTDLPQAQALQSKSPVPSTEALQGRVYLAVPYVERNEAKAAGAEWDKAAKSWYAGPRADMSKLDRFKPENVQAQQGPAMTPQEEFAEALRSMQCVVTEPHPIMNGKKQRITVVGDKHSDNAGAGFYVGHLDGHPAGYIKNNKTDKDLKWKSKGYSLSPEAKAQLAADAAATLQARAVEQAATHLATAQRVSTQLESLQPVHLPTPYLAAKGIEPQPGIFTDRNGLTTYIPATDADGKQWSMQYIQEDGTKRFAKDSRKEGCFAAIGGMDALAKAPALVIGEGYATAATLSESLGFSTVAAFDAGNILAVATALHAKFPEKPLFIAGDDDRHLELTQGSNPGKTKAREAAEATGGKMLLPIFAPGENNYPAGLPPVTVAQYREHQQTGSTLSAEQVAALAHMKKMTDFNDLAEKSALGHDGLRRQVNVPVFDVIERQQAQLKEQQEHIEPDEKLVQRKKTKPPKIDKPEQRPRRLAKI